MDNDIYVRDLLIQGKKGDAGQRKPAFYDRERPVVPYRAPSLDRLARIKTQLEHLVETARNHHKSAAGINTITRLITDEFCFYPDDGPLTISEYRAIIDELGQLCKNLQPNIHLVLGTFPVLWPDGGMHNCGLHITSPNSPASASAPSDPPRIHHFSKQNHSGIDFEYRTSATSYDTIPLTTDMNCAPEALPEKVLAGTAATLGDVNQFQGALKITTESGDAFVTTIGICLDHQEDVERRQTHGLIEQLAARAQHIPTTCSHVIVSASVYEHPDNILSTMSHADPEPARRTGLQMGSNGLVGIQPPGRQGFTPFAVDGTDFTGEEYPVKKLGQLHGDVLDHAVACSHGRQRKPNQQDAQGLTELHKVFMETDWNRELWAKRCYDLIVRGENPDLPDAMGQTARKKAEAWDKKFNLSGNLLSDTIDWALRNKAKFEMHNLRFDANGHTPFAAFVSQFIKQHERPLSEADKTMLEKQLVQFIQAEQASPYAKGPPKFESVYDIIKKSFPGDGHFLQLLEEQAKAAGLTRATPRSPSPPPPPIPWDINSLPTSAASSPSSSPLLPPTHQPCGVTNFVLDEGNKPPVDPVLSPMSDRSGSSDFLYKARDSNTDSPLVAPAAPDFTSNEPLLSTHDLKAQANVQPSAPIAKSTWTAVDPESFLSTDGQSFNRADILKASIGLCGEHPEIRDMGTAILDELTYANSAELKYVNKSSATLASRKLSELLGAPLPQYQEDPPSNKYCLFLSGDNWMRLRDLQRMPSILRSTYKSLSGFFSKESERFENNGQQKSLDEIIVSLLKASEENPSGTGQSC